MTFSIRGIGIKAENNSRRHCEPVTVQCFYCFHHRQYRIVFLVHYLQRIGFWSLDADKNVDKLCLAHQCKNFSMLGQVKRCFASKLQWIITAALPFDEMRQHFSRCFAVADKIIVDKIDYGRVPGLFEHLIQFARNLLWRLEPRLAAIKCGNVTKLAAIRTATRKLQTPDEVMVETN